MAKKLTDEEREARNAKRRAKSKAKAETKVEEVVEEVDETVDENECTTCKDPKTGDTITFEISRTCWIHVKGRETVLKVRRGERYDTVCENEISALDAAHFKRRL